MPADLPLVRDDAQLLVIDVQTKLLPSIHGAEAVLDAAVRAVHGARLFGVPVVATEQYPQGIGPTATPLVEALERSGAARFDKMTFSCCPDTPIAQSLEKNARRDVVIVGIEAHVCVMQTALELAASGYTVRVCADAVGSRTAADYVNALQRLRAAGIIVTTVESVLFELCHACGTADFKAMIEIIKTPRPADPRYS